MAEGQFLGTRSAYVYTTDAEDLYILQLDDTLAALTGTDLEDYTGQADAKPAPKRFSPRIVYWESNDRSKRKRIVCGKGDSALYGQETSSKLTVDGVEGFTTGRVGEKLTYVRAKEAADG
jgi:hypothetical protein